MKATPLKERSSALLRTMSLGGWEVSLRGSISRGESTTIDNSVPWSSWILAPTPIGPSLPRQAPCAWRTVPKADERKFHRPRSGRQSGMMSHDDNSTRFCLKSEVETTGSFCTMWTSVPGAGRNGSRTFGGQLLLHRVWWMCDPQSLRLYFKLTHHLIIATKGCHFPQRWCNKRGKATTTIQSIQVTPCPN